MTSSYSHTRAVLAVSKPSHRTAHKQPIVTRILTTDNKLHNQKDLEASIQWIPGHCDIPGNDRAYKLAKQETSKTQGDGPVSYAASKLTIQTKSRKIWHDRRARGTAGRICCQHHHTPSQTDHIKQLYRPHHTARFRLSTNPAPLNAHLHRIKKEHQAKCVPDSDETLDHPLLHAYKVCREVARLVG